jgi:hypothetical protein
LINLKKFNALVKQQHSLGFYNLDEAAIDRQNLSSVSYIGDKFYPSNKSKLVVSKMLGEVNFNSNSNNSNSKNSIYNVQGSSIADKLHFRNISEYKMSNLTTPIKSLDQVNPITSNEPPKNNFLHKLNKISETLNIKSNSNNK